MIETAPRVAHCQCSFCTADAVIRVTPKDSDGSPTTYFCGPHAATGVELSPETIREIGVVTVERALAEQPQ